MRTKAIAISFSEFGQINAGGLSVGGSAWI